MVHFLHVPAALCKKSDVMIEFYKQKGEDRSDGIYEVDRIADIFYILKLNWYYFTPVSPIPIKSAEMNNSLYEENSTG